MNELKVDITRIGIFLGGMRCGSTAINDYLKMHPEICMYKNKDSHFFSGNDEWIKGWENYLSGLGNYNPNIHKVAFESATHYTKYPLYKDTAKRMASSPFEMKLIYGVRPPLERIESHMIHNAGKGYFDPNNKEERKKVFTQAIFVSDYLTQLARFEKYFSNRQIKVIETKLLISEPQKTLGNICKFLGVSDTYKFDIIERRPRIFKNDITKFKLTDKELEEANSYLYENTKKFEKHHNLNLWDGCNK